MTRLLLLLALYATPLLAIDVDREYRCICAVETGGRDLTGRSGERGPAQIGTAARVTIRGKAIDYVRWLIQITTDPTPYRIALAHHCGPTGMQHPNRLQRDYAQRVANLYGDPTFR